jgi:hypothetical protein
MTDTATTPLAELHQAIRHAEAVLPPVAAQCVVAHLLAVQHAAGDGDVKRFVARVIALPDRGCRADALHARITSAFAVCREWESVADEYLTSDEAAEVGDEHGFSLVKRFSGRIREALTQSIDSSSMADDTIRAASVEADSERGMWYIHVLDAAIHHTNTDVHANVDRDADDNIVGVEILGSGCDRGNEVTR